MSHLDAIRATQARDVRADVLPHASERARRVADLIDVPLTIVLRVLVPHMTAKGLSAREIAERLDVSERAVVRHRARMRVA